MVRSTSVAQFEAYFSRPVAPTRRIAIGGLRFPDAAAASMLLGGVVATFADALDEDDSSELHRLIDDVDTHRRVAQPRLRHRLQKDRIGLKRSVNRLIEVDPGGSDGRLTYRLDVDRGNGTATQHCLAAVYCARSFDDSDREKVCAALRLGLAWAGSPGEDLLAVLRAGRTNGYGPPVGASTDPVTWAMELLGLVDDSDDGGEEAATGRRRVQRAFRSALRDAHPDHGAPIDGAAQRIAELNAARSILLG